MQLVKWLKSKFGNARESADSLPASLTGSQKSQDTEQILPIFLRPQFGLLHPFDFSEYLKLYVNDSLCKAIVDADVNLTVSELEYSSESDEVNEYMEDFHRRIGMDQVLWELVRDVSLFGCAFFEIIGNASTLLGSSRVEAIKRLDPRFIFVQKNALGRIGNFRQRFTIANAAAGLLDNVLNADSILYCHSLSPITTYGQSILQSLKTRVSERNKLLAATTTAHVNHANAVNWLQYVIVEMEGRDQIQKEIDRQIESLNKATSDIDDKGTRWLISGGAGAEYKYTRLGAEQLPESRDLIREVTLDILCSAGFSPSLFGLSDSKTQDESSRYTVNSIVTRQRNVMSQIHEQLYSLLPFVESECPADNADQIRVDMLAPTEESNKERLEAEAIKLNNVGLSLRMGVISPEQAARELGYDEVFDKERLEEFLSSNSGEMNPNDPNQDQQARKAILSKGKTPGNNPSGGKK